MKTANPLINRTFPGKPGQAGYQQRYGAKLKNRVVQP